MASASIDTGHAGSLPRIARAINGLGYSIDDIQRVVCTHGHPDHAGSAQAFADLGIDVWIHPDDAVNLDVGFSDAIRHPSRGRVFAAMTPPLDRFKPLQDGLVLPALGGLEVVHTPGHTPGSVCLFAPGPGLLFVGDTLQRQFGRVSFASGLFSDDAAAARASVQRLAPLHVKTIVFSHYPALDEGAANDPRWARPSSPGDVVGRRSRRSRVDTLVELVRDGGQRFADHPALIIRPSFRTRTMTHGDLAEMVPRAARVLSETGLEPGDRAIIWAVNRPEWGLAFLAVAHLGGVAVPKSTCRGRRRRRRRHGGGDWWWWRRAGGVGGGGGGGGGVGG